MKTRIKRWVLRLLPYQFKVRYRPGSTNAADASSESKLSQSLAQSYNLTEQYIRYGY